MENVSEKAPEYHYKAFDSQGNSIECDEPEELFKKLVEPNMSKLEIVVYRKFKVIGELK